MELYMVVLLFSLNHFITCKPQSNPPTWTDFLSKWIATDNPQSGEISLEDILKINLNQNYLQESSSMTSITGQTTVVEFRAIRSSKGSNQPVQFSS